MNDFLSRAYLKNISSRIASGFRKVGLKKHARPAFIVLGVLFAALIIVVPQPTHANWISEIIGTGAGVIGALTGSVIAWAVFVVMYVFGIIAGFAISVITYFIAVLLAVNTNIPNSYLVKEGFQITLAITNLFFVLGIIVIAIATIIRSQTYGMKQILWKLVVMAILVNFGLVLAAPIISFSDQLTNYFLNAFVPDSGSASSYNAFATSLAGAFTPQRAFLINGGDVLNEGAKGGTISAGSSFANIITPLLGLVFPVLFVVFIGIVLGVLVVMLFIRYVYLSYLLILLPFAWLAWVFPEFKSHFHKWWNLFIRWTFFAPIVVFFLYLAILSSRAMSGGTLGPNDPLSATKGPAFNAGNSLVAGMQNIAGNFIGSIISDLVQMATILAISIGGLMIANSMGIAFADVGVKAATNVSKGFGNYVGRRSTQAGTTLLRTKRGKDIATSLQNFGAGRGRIGRTLSLPVRYLGGGVQGLAVRGGEKAVDQGADSMKGMTDEQVANGMARFTAPERIAAIERLHKNGNFGMIKNPELYMEDKAMFERYNKGKAMEAVEGESGYGLIKRERAGKADIAEWEASGGKKGRSKEQVEEDTQKYLKSAGSAGNLAKTFLYNDDQLKELAKVGGKGLPMGVKTIEEMHKIQDTILLGVAKSFTGTNISQFFQQATKKDQLDAIPEIVNRLKAQGQLTDQAQLSDAARKYLTSSGAKTLGIGVETLMGEKTISKSEESDEKTVTTTKTTEEKKIILEEPRNIRERVVFDAQGKPISPEEE